MIRLENIISSLSICSIEIMLLLYCLLDVSTAMPSVLVTSLICVFLPVRDCKLNHIRNIDSSAATERNTKSQ